MTAKQPSLTAWLKEKLIERVGNEKAQQIIDDARNMGTNNTAYILGAIDALGHTDISTEYKLKRQQIYHERTVRNNKYYLDGYKEQLATCTNKQRAEWIKDRIQRIEARLAKEDNEN